MSQIAFSYRLRVHTVGFVSSAELTNLGAAGRASPNSTIVKDSGRWPNTASSNRLGRLGKSSATDSLIRESKSWRLSLCGRRLSASAQARNLWAFAGVGSLHHWGLESSSV